MERYLAIVHPIVHKVKFTRDKVYVGIFISWFVGIMYNILWEVPSSDIIDGSCLAFAVWPNDATQRFVGVVTFITQYFFPITMMTFCYSRMVYALRQKVSPADHHDGNKTGGGEGGGGGAGAGSASTERARRNLMKTLIIVCACFVACWTCNEVFLLMYTLGYPTDFTGWFYHFTVVAVFTNCCLNPFVYATKYKEFQQGVRRLAGQVVSRFAASAGSR